MKILNLIASLDPTHGGPIDGALQLSRIWRLNGHDVSFATLDHPQAAYIADLDFTVAALGPRGRPDRDQRPLRLSERFAYSPDYRPWLRAHVGEHDAVIVHSLWNYSILAARRELVGGDTPYFLFPHGTLDPWFRRHYPVKHAAKSLVWPFSEGPLVNNAAAIFLTTEEESKLAAGMFLPWRAKPVVVGFGAAEPGGDPAVQVSAFRAAVPALGARRFLLFLSRIHPKKGCDLLIKAFAATAALDPDLDLVIAGPDQDGWQAELETLAASLGVASRVHWTGMIVDDVKWGAFRACEAFILPSHSENFGIVVAEALASGRLVLMTDKVNLWREVDAAGAGLIEPDTEAGAMALIRQFLALDPARREAMGRAARACYEANFRMERTAAKVIDVMRQRGARG